ncbi:MAG: PaaI family thioesterase [Actinobacteria bacterium]|nr:MAG: PaaI family thioesterase [Actinomycetota bacterium]
MSARSQDSGSLQERLLPGTTCFGCGPANVKGLQLCSFPAPDDADATVAEFLPWPEHDNGLGYLNGGIICTVLDCHSATPMLLAAERLGLLSPTQLLPYVTAGLQVRYLRPTPLAEPLALRAWITSGDESAMTVAAELSHGGKVRAAATAEWRRWRPRA